MAHYSNIQAKWNATFNTEAATISCPDSCLLTQPQTFNSQEATTSCLLTQPQIVNLIIDVKILGCFMAVMTINTSV